MVVASVTLARDVPAHIEGRHVLLRRLEGARDDVEELVGDILPRGEDESEGLEVCESLEGRPHVHGLARPPEQQ